MKYSVEPVGTGSKIKKNSTARLLHEVWTWAHLLIRLGNLRNSVPGIKYG